VTDKVVFYHNPQSPGRDGLRELRQHHQYVGEGADAWGVSFSASISVPPMCIGFCHRLGHVDESHRAATGIWRLSWTRGPAAGISACHGAE